MSTEVAFVYDHLFAQHVLRGDHPMKPIRLKYTYDLLDAYGAFGESSYLVSPRPATIPELTSFHSKEYVEAVQRFSSRGADSDMARFNFSAMGDNPVFSGMYEAAALSTGGSIGAAELVAREQVKTAFNIAGGLHHAGRNHSSGFCVFNDPVIAINYFLEQGLKVAYVDMDAHHGDGVQEAFYETDQVLTISVHESGQFLFPGTGFTEEIGSGNGRGYSVNVPLFPYTGDDIYLWVFQEVVIPLIKGFHPDVLVSQLGIDSHYNDPITHLRLSSLAFSEVVQAFVDLHLPWLALGGGGYDLSAVARCWTLAFGKMISREWSEEIPYQFANAYGIKLLRDGFVSPVTKEIEDQITRYAETSVHAVKRSVFPVYNLE